MSREAYNSLPNIGTRGSPGNRTRRLTELPQVDNSPSRDFVRGSPLGKTFTKITKKSLLLTIHKKKFTRQTPTIYFYSSQLDIKLHVITPLTHCSWLIKNYRHQFTFLSPFSDTFFLSKCNKLV